MRNIKFEELKLKNINDVDTFYSAYLKTLNNIEKHNHSFNKPSKQYEIFYLDELDDRSILLNKDYIQKEDTSGQDLFFDYSIAFKIYNLMLDISDGIQDEQNEFNELYKDERLEKYKEILELRNKDDELFSKAVNEYNIITNSSFYNNYLDLVEENKKLKEENTILKENYNVNLPKRNTNFFQKIFNKFKN